MSKLEVVSFFLEIESFCLGIESFPLETEKTLKIVQKATERKKAKYLQPISAKKLLSTNTKLHCIIHHQKQLCLCLYKLINSPATSFATLIVV